MTIGESPAQTLAPCGCTPDKCCPELLHVAILSALVRRYAIRCLACGNTFMTETPPLPVATMPEPETLVAALAAAERETAEVEGDRDAWRAQYVTVLAERDRLRERLQRIDENAGELCEANRAEDPCGPVEYHDVEGVPLCAECWQECVDDAEPPALAPAPRPATPDGGREG